MGIEPASPLPLARPAADAPRQSGETGESDEQDSRDGLYLYGIVRSRSWRSASRRAAGLTLVRFRDLEAIVRAVPYREVVLEDSALHDHQRTLDTTMRRGTVLPVPFGLVFQGRRAVIRFLEDQYIVMDEGLAFLEGHWELRLHIMAREESDAHEDLCTAIYSELRRFAHAALPLPAVPGRLLSAAFLVDRADWIKFVEHSEDMNHAHPELVFDLTGPWPPYDFVKVRS